MAAIWQPRADLSVDLQYVRCAVRQAYERDRKRSGGEGGIQTNTSKP
jgi:hypothetical protein